MRRVFVISCLHPASVAADPQMYKRELRYSQSLLLDCIARGEAPLAGQLNMIRLLCDIDADRHMVDALLEVQAQWLDASDALIVGCDLGVTPEMQMLIDLAKSWDIPVELRMLEDYAVESEYASPSAYVM